MIHLSDLLEATAGAVYGPVGPAVFESFGFDSRIIRPGQLFVAVVTERADGHAYALDAVRNGAGGVLSQQPIDLAEHLATCIVVPDTRRAMQDWARRIVEKQQLAVIGITGSVGKTTAKEAIAAVLSGDRPVFRNRANYNGLFGLPIALSEIGPDDRIAVLEMAADHFGEIRALTAIARPRIAVVTTVEPAHLETFGSLEAIAREKSALVASLPADGLAVLNADDARVAAMAEIAPGRVLTYGTADATAGRSCPDVCASNVVPGRDGVAFTVDTPAGRRKARIPLLGRHQVYAALAAIAVGLAQGIDLDEIVARLATMPRVPGRLNPLPGLRGSLLLDDSYSSSPAAAEAALDTLAALEGRRKIAVLGDMLELGAFEAAGHEQVGRKAAGIVDLLVTRGNRARRIGEAARDAGLPEECVVVTYTAEDAARAALSGLGPGDIALVKGSLATRMEQVVRLLMADPLTAEERLVRQDAAWRAAVTLFPDRPTWLEIDHGAIAHNVRRLVELAGGRQLLISLKADAYGHGAIQVAQTALLNGASWLGVATLSEGVALREAGIRAPVLILGFTPAWQARDALRHGLTPTVYDLDVGRALSRAALALDRPARAHVKVDTGMGRLGIFPDETAAFVRELDRLPGLTVEGIFTHLAVADGDTEWDQTYTGDQLRKFDRLLEQLERDGIRIPLVHGVNSAGLLDTTVGYLASSRALARHTLVRAGIAVYGLYPSAGVPLPADFRPALAWKTQVAQVKHLPPGSYVSYGATYRTTGQQTIAVIPVGYADGFRRSPQNWGEVLVRGRRAPIVGRVTMDQTMIDVTAVAGVRQGDEVVLIGKQGGESITAEDVAARLGTINYEVVSAILAAGAARDSRIITATRICAAKEALCQMRPGFWERTSLPKSATLRWASIRKRLSQSWKASRSACTAGRVTTSAGLSRRAASWAAAWRRRATTPARRAPRRNCAGTSTLLTASSQATTASRCTPCMRKRPAPSWTATTCAPSTLRTGSPGRRRRVTGWISTRPTSGHPMAATGFTLSSYDKGVRDFWVEHGILCRHIGAYFGRELGTTCLNNHWIPDGMKDTPADRKTPRLLLKDSLDRIFAEPVDTRYNLDAVEGKLFGIGAESYTVGSHEFYLGYAVANKLVYTLDSGHYHPTETISDKLSSVLPFVQDVMLHVSRGVRWDSDHVVILNDDLQAIMQEIVRGDYLGRVHIGLDFFDASINRIAAWTVGTRNAVKALLMAMLEPYTELQKMDAEGDYTARLVLLEELKSMPFGAVWDAYCLRQDAPVGYAVMDEIRRYERTELAHRS